MPESKKIEPVDPSKIKVSVWGFKLNKKQFLVLYFSTLLINLILVLLAIKGLTISDFLFFVDKLKKGVIISFLDKHTTLIIVIYLFYTIIDFQFFWNRFTKKQLNIIENLKKEIEEKNKEIIDSINYAKRIQQAKLPQKGEIYSSLPNSFILFKPKDIVSGDFYFFHKNNNSILIAAADCTGHGVPGALMSMIGSEQLNDAVWKSRDTSEILKHLNKGIKISLRQSEHDESTRDGMDIALCSVDTKKCIVNYAGANRPIWIIRNGQTEVEEIKPTKTAIGGLTEDNQHFDTHEIKLQQGDTFYILFHDNLI